MVYLTAYFGMPMELGMFGSVFLALFFNSPAARKGTLWSSFLAIRLMVYRGVGRREKMKTGVTGAYSISD